MSLARRLFGASGERQAEVFLQKKGYRILDRNFRTRYGEIDLVARDGDEIVFVEVKHRKTADFGYPEESVTASKLQKMHRTAMQYLEKHTLLQEYRIDVIAICGTELVHLIGVAN